MVVSVVLKMVYNGFRALRSGGAFAKRPDPNYSRLENQSTELFHKPMCVRSAGTEGEQRIKSRIFFDQPR